MVKAIQIPRAGGAEVLTAVEVDLAPPRAGEVRLVQEYAGLNYIDVYHRTGLYPLEYPAIIGMEGAGVVEAVGEGVTTVCVGDRVAYGTELGGYCAARNIRASRLVKLPENVDTRTAAGAMLQGLTAQYLLRRTYQVQPGDQVLIQAATGGVGLIACQWAKHLGATVIGTVGSPEKAELARANGCDFTINYREEDFVERVKEITDGQGVAVAYDGVGIDTFPGSLDCIQPLGMWVSFGQSSGPLPDFNLGMLAARGSLMATRPSLIHYAAKDADLAIMADELMAVISSGAVKINVAQEFALEAVGDAHEALTGRKTQGSTVLKV